MSLYVCTECGCVDNTSQASYYRRKMEGLPPLCCVCDPEVGVWHDRFPRVKWDGVREVNNPGDAPPGTVVAP